LKKHGAETKQRWLRKIMKKPANMTLREISAGKKKREKKSSWEKDIPRGEKTLICSEKIRTTSQSTIEKSRTPKAAEKRESKDGTFQQVPERKF